MTEFFNRTTEKAMRRQLRKAMPKAEVLVWSTAWEAVVWLQV